MIRLAIAISHPIQYHAPLYTHLAKDGRFDLHVYYMTDRGARPYFEPFAKTMVQFDNPILSGYEYTFLRRGEPESAWQKKTEFYQFSLTRHLARWKPEAVYFHGYDNPAFWPAILWCRRKGVAVLFRGENEDVLPRPPLRKLLRELFLRAMFPLIDAFLYIGEENRRFFLRRGVAPGRLFYVPYSVDNGYFRGGVSEAELRRLRTGLRSQYSLPSDCRLFIYTHKLRETMKPLDAVRGFGQASAAFRQPAALLICGDGEQKGEAEALAAEWPGARIVFAGYLSQSGLRLHLLGSDVMLNPAIEPWGCTVNEGLASGLAMISSDLVVGWPDMVRSGVNGEVHPAGDIPKLAALIAEFANLSTERIEAMKRASFALATDVLSFSTCADGIAAACESLRKR